VHILNFVPAYFPFFSPAEDESNRDFIQMQESALGSKAKWRHFQTKSAVPQQRNSSVRAARLLCAKERNRSAVGRCGMAVPAIDGTMERLT